MATGSTQVAAEDFQGLGRFEAYASLVAEGSVQPWCSLRTEPPSKSTSDPAAVRAASSERYGRDRAEIEAQLEQLLTVSRRTSVDDLSPRRRSVGGQL